MWFLIVFVFDKCTRTSKCIKWRTLCRSSKPRQKFSTNQIFSQWIKKQLNLHENNFQCAILIFKSEYLPSHSAFHVKCTVSKCVCALSMHTSPSTYYTNVDPVQITKSKISSSLVRCTRTASLNWLASYKKWHSFVVGNHVITTVIPWF